MFCQQCGAELRGEAEFCALCGTAVPRPRLHIEPARETPGRGRLLPGQGSSRYGRAPAPAPLSTFSAAQSKSRLVPDRAQPSYEAIRQASGYRSAARQIAPIASLEVRPADSSPAPAQAGPAEAPDDGRSADPAQAVPLHNGVAHGAALPTPSNEARSPQLVPLASGQAASGREASLAPETSDQAPPGSNGHHADAVVEVADRLNRPYEDVSAGSYTRQVLGATIHFTLPGDIPNRVALGALLGMLLSFFLPWLILSNIRATPLSIGWPVILPLAVIVFTILTILAPNYTLYARFLLALPLGLGCFALGSALLLFLLSSALAANTVGASFLGVDIGFAFFVVAALVLTCAGYYKLIRELPLLQSGRLHLAPLPGMLRVLSERSMSVSSQRPAPGQQPVSSADEAGQEHQPMG